MESFEAFSQKCTNDDIELTLTFKWLRSNLLSGVSHGEFMELVEDLVAKVKKSVT